MIAYPFAILAYFVVANSVEPHMFVTQRTAPSALSRSPFVRSLCLALVVIECRLFSCLPLIVHHGARPVCAPAL